MNDIILSTLNAKYIHASLGLRYLYANMDDWQDATKILEFTIDKRPADMAEQLLNLSPRIIGFGVYIWNIEQTTQLIRLIKKVAPQIKIVIGGPEVTYEWQGTEIFALSDYLVRGQGDLAFAALCEDILAGRAPIDKVLQPDNPKLSDLLMPYDAYNDEDIAHRLLYVEASRGCPFKCEFCLSSLDKTAWPFDLDDFLGHMDRLHRRGARHFKFVDRTFNLKIKSSIKIMEFFLERMSDDLFVHFEIIPDHLPDALKEMIQKFPAGCLQFEVGVQTFNPDVQARISRKQDNEKTRENLSWLRQHTQAHLHADLIFGLPGESYDSFKQSFDQLVALGPHEIQVGILKRLKGSPIIRHSDAYAMVYADEPPYSVISTQDVSFFDVQRMNRFARYWDMIANSGRFKHVLPYVINEAPFDQFSALTDWLFEHSAQTHKIALPKLFLYLHDYLSTRITSGDWLSALIEDFSASGTKGLPPWEKVKRQVPSSVVHRSVRQNRHLPGRP